jgi:AraC-like DNA-binding protein
MRDVAVTDLHGVSPVRTAGIPRGVEDQVRMYVVRRGAWTLDDPRDRGDERTVPAGGFLLRHFGPPPGFRTAPHTTAKILFLPAAIFKPLLGGRVLAGATGSPEMRLLLAHTNMVHATIADLIPAGVRAARGTLVELARAVTAGRFDDAEPLLAAPLARAAMDLADRHLADPELSTVMLATELNVSVRTLQRAFAALGQSVTGYVRRRRLEEARLALIAPSGLTSVSELAAYLQFADSSHFTRAFKKQYGRTPTDYARSVGPAGRDDA